ncbi:MAG: M2 family metallopeptidase [Myxococcota bacterium]
MGIRFSLFRTAPLAIVLIACSNGPGPVAPDGGAATAAAGPPPPPASPESWSPADADALVKRYNEEGFRIGLESGRAEWIKSTYITPDSKFISSKAGERWLNFKNEILESSKNFVGMEGLSADTARALKLIKSGTTMPSPKDAAKVSRLAAISAELGGMYGEGKYCDEKGECRDLEKLMDVMGKSRNYDELLDAWTGWRTISPPMRKLYQEFAGLMNEGAKELGYADTGALWKSGYDMTGPQFEAESERLWQQVRPLYEQLHCYVRARLSKVYGPDKVALDKPIPAHLLGNMWAQEWNNIFELVRPYPTGRPLGIDRALKAKGYDPVKMVKSAEAFYTSIGLKSLPESFWKLSLFQKPRDREVVCHASAWDLDLPNDDVRIKMCIDAVNPNEEDLVTIYHELGHIYYYLYYKGQPLVFQRGAHDGFHEAIGDALTLSMTPSFYEKIGLARQGPGNDKALINQMLKSALEKIAFLPFGKLVDQWRWDVFSGKTKPTDYNRAWWALRTEYQGIAPPTPRSESNFDPGAKYHIPGNTPYTRYFLARILQFQFHRSLCEAAGHEGPLHECSIYESKEAGKRLSAMLALGQSKPWPEALEKMTGQRQMDASAIIDFYQPLMTWLKKENQGQTCGW